MVMINISGNRRGSPLSGIKPNSRSVIVAGKMVKAKRPTVMAARFLPNFLEMTGVTINAITAESATDREICPN